MKRLGSMVTVLALLGMVSSVSAAWLQSGNGDWFGNTWWDAGAGAYKTPDLNDDLWLYGTATVTLDTPGALAKTLVVGNNDTHGTLLMGPGGGLTIASADAFRIGYGNPGGDGTVSVAGELNVGWHMNLGEWIGGTPGVTGGTFEVVGSSANINVGGNFVAGNGDGAGGSSTSVNTLRYVFDAGCISTINVTDQTYFYPGSIELDIAGPVVPGTYTLISSTNFGTTIEGMGFAPGVDTNIYSLSGGNGETDLLLHVIPEPITVALFGLGGLLLRRRS